MTTLQPSAIWNYGTTVSVMDMNSLTVLKTIPVRINPVKALADSAHHVWVMSWGNYKTEKSCIQCIDTQTDSVIATFDENVSDFDIHNNIVYLLCSDYTDPWLACKSIDAIAFRMETLFEKTSLTTPYNLNIRPADGSIWICDALDYSSFGNVYVPHIFACPKTGQHQNAAAERGGCDHRTHAGEPF